VFVLNHPVWLGGIDTCTLAFNIVIKKKLTPGKKFCTIICSYDFNTNVELCIRK